MESRALSIAFFYAVGTAAGGIAGPLLFGHLINTGSQSKVAIGFFIGAATMAVGGIAELFFGVKAEQRQLEDIAEPLTAADGEGDGEGDGGSAEAEVGGDEASAEQPSGRVRGRYRPGPARYRGSPGMPVSHPYPAADLRREVEIIDRALKEGGSADRRELRRRVGARYWGPGHFNAALREAVGRGRARHLRGGQFAPVGGGDEEPAPAVPQSPQR